MLRRRNLLKRVMPILLSLAMMLQSVPITAMAAELPVAATAEEAEAAESAEETEATVESTEETGAAEDADAAESAAQPEEDATVEDAAAEDGVKSDETTEDTGDQPDAVTEEDGAKSDDAAEDSESEPETVKKPVAEAETEIPAVGADAQKPGVARIVVNDTDVWEEFDGFTRKHGEEGLVFFTKYDEDSRRVGEFQEYVQYWLDVEVDGEPVDALKNSLTYSWAKVDGETREPLVDAVPVDAGTYELTISLAAAPELYETVEPEKLTLIIEKAEIHIWLDTWTQPGKTVGELIENNNENYQIVYADRMNEIGDDEYAPKYTVSRDIINREGKKLPIHIWEINKDGARQDLTETPDVKFNSTKDYILTIEKPESDLLTADAAKNYELALEDFWKINVGERQNTWIKFERKTEENGDLKDLIEVYEEGKTYSIEDVTKDLFTETGAPAVYVWDDKTEEDVALKDADGEPVKPVAGWYTRIQLEQNDKKLAETEKYVPDEEAGEFQYEWEDEEGNKVKDDFIYKPMKEGETPTDAGEYYIVWNYAGDEGAYVKSHSEPIRFTIDPAPVVVSIDLDGVDYTEGKGAKLGFTDGMTAGDVRKTLAKLAYGVYPIKENAEGVPEVGKDKVNKEPHFFGTSYGIENTTQMTQYFVPEFVLQRRPVSMTEKDGTVITIPEEEVDGKKVKRAVDWNPVDVDWRDENYPALNVVVDNENGGLKSIKDELPQDAEIDNLKSVEFEFRVYFTGNKVVYTKDGYKRGYFTPVTDVTTNAANRNYLADITKSRLEDSAVLLDVPTATPVTINTDAIIQAFIDENGESLYPQMEEGAENPHKGTFSDPAVKIYDQKGLFEKRSSYKKAEVFDVENGDPGVTTNIKNTDERLTYTWNYIDLDTYQEYLETWDKEQQKYKDFDEFYFENAESWGWINVEDGTLEYPKSAGVYRLTVKFNDKDLAYRSAGEKVYRSAEAEVFFKVAQQEVIVVPTKVQYVSEDDQINSLSVSCNSLEVKKDYRIYKIPQNSEDSAKKIKELAEIGDEASLEALKEYEEIPTDVALSSYEAKNGTKYPADIINSEKDAGYWKVLRKAKDTEGQDTGDWVEVESYEKFDRDYIYGFVANWEGFGFYVEDGETGPLGEASGYNYTTLDVKTYRETGEIKHHEAAGKVDFYDGKIYVEVNKELIEALGHEYDGTPFGKKADGTEITLEEVAKAITLYTDDELKNKLAEDCTKFINTTDEYDPTKINIYWVKDDNGEIYATKNAVYGDTYTLALRFEGGALAAEETAQDGEEEPKYAPLGDNGWWYPWNFGYNGENSPEFTITPRAVTITPELVSEDLLKAGDQAYGLVTGNLTSGKKDKEGNFITDEEGNVVESILEKDEKFFEYMELAKGGFDAAWDRTNPEGKDLEKTAYAYSVGSAGGYPAFDGSAYYAIQVDGREIQYNYDYLRYGKTYTVKLKNGLVSPLAESYRVTYAPATVEIKNRGNAEVDEINGNPRNLSTGRIDYNFSDGTYTVMPRGAVKFYYSEDGIEVKDRYGEVKKLENTNVLGFRIWAPNEFRSDPDFYGSEAYTEKFVYKNAIWNAGGYFYENDKAEWKPNIVKDVWGEEFVDGYYIDVVFPLTKDTLDLSFNITWENEYTETFKLADVALEEDLTKAVAPKSMAFNGVATKMAVGERQQLNLKITKAQLGDVIAVRYRIKGSEETKNKWISLDPETGVVTALNAEKPATTQIEAYAVYKDAKGNFVPIEDSKKKQKVATTKITVTDVTAPAIKKIVAQGNSAKVYYTVPDNGYRREVYVVDVADNAAAKKWKAAQFNDAIAGIKNGDWKTAGFAIAPQYSYKKIVDMPKEESLGRYDSKLKAHILTLNGLKAEHEYVVYVRNVSAVRELDDGSVVTLSAMGSVKKAKTTKPQVNDLELDFTLKTDEKDKKNTVTHPVGTDGKVDTNTWTVELTAKKAQLNVYGYFSDKDAAAELQDQLKYPLVPTSKDKAIKAALKNYQLPKLEYAIFDEDKDDPFKPGLTQSKYAAINKKGLISLKGVDLNGETTLYIYVRDNMKYQGTTDYSAEANIELTVTSKATSFAGKKVKAVVGQEICLADCLTYKDGKKTLPNYRSGNIQITPAMKNAAKAAGYEIVDRGEWDEKNNRWVHNWYITAVSPNKNKFVLEVSDFDIDGNPKANITLTSKQVDPVKGLKVTYVDDKNITINFTHAANKDKWDSGQVYDYAFEIRDARGNVVEKKILQYPDIVRDIDRANAKELKSVLSWIQKQGTTVSDTKLKDNAIKVSDKPAENQFNYYTGTNAKVKTFAYTYTNTKLVRLSSYTISVTPLYGNQKDIKAATTKTKTTNIPASYKNPDLTGNAPDRRGGTPVVVTTTDRKQQNTNLDSKDNKGKETLTLAPSYWFTSGNTYTLKLTPNDLGNPETYLTDDDVPRDRVTDTLTWKSSNTKVATIKANAGTYTATFKPVNQGETTITVTSKVTKKVIARWAVKVRAIGDGTSYGGDYEPTWDNGFYENILALYDPYYDGPVEVLSVNVPLTISNGKTWVSFTAPHYGVYTLKSTNGWDVEDADEEIIFYDSRDGSKIALVSDGDDREKNMLVLEANQKVYCQLGNGRWTVTGTELARLTKANTKESPLEVKEGHVSFTAWEDNVYTFWLNGTQVNLGSEEDKYYEARMNAGDTWYVWANTDGKMYVTWRDLGTPAVLNAAKDILPLDKDNQTRYVTYTVNEAGEYAFKYVYDEGITPSISYANGEDLERVKVSEAGPETLENGKLEKTESYYLEAGQKVVIEFKAEPVITDNAKTLSASVTVTAPERRKVEKEITIPKGTTEIVEYVIPTFDTEKAQIKFKVTDGSEIVKYLDKDYQDISKMNTPDDNWTEALDANNNTLTISKNTWPVFKANDSIFIEVKAGGDPANEDDKDAVLTATWVSVETLALSTTPKDITNDTEQWYIFKAPKDGFYEFNVNVSERAAGDETDTHEALLKLGRDLFAATDDWRWVRSDVEGTVILDLKSGETLALKLTPGTSVDNNKNADGTVEVIKSTANISVNLLEPTPLKLGKEEPVKIDAGKKDVLYYSFTATVADNYTIGWKSDEGLKDVAVFEYLSNIPNGTTKYGTYFSAGEVRYIKVSIDPDQINSGNPVSGNLCVTADNLNATVLTENNAENYNLENKNGAREQVFKFTAPQTAEYAVELTVANDKDTDLPYNYPGIRRYKDNYYPDNYDYYYDQVMNNARYSLTKGQTCYLTLSLYGTDTETAGTILIRSMTEEVTGDQTEVTVAKDVVKQYTFKIPESGRYEFKADYDKVKAGVKVGKYYKYYYGDNWDSLQDLAVASGSYYRKNQEVTISVKGNDSEADASVKLSKPAPITPKELVVGDNDVDVKPGEANYFEISVTDPKTFELKIKDIEGLAEPELYYAQDNTPSLTRKYDEKPVIVSKNSKLFIKVMASDEKKALTCKLNVAESKELKVGSNEINLKAGETAKMIFRAPEKGYYSFQVEGKDLVLKVDEGATETGDSFNKPTGIMNPKATHTYTLTNEGTAEVKSVTVKAIEPIPVTPGSKTDAKEIAAGEVAYYALKTFKDADYLIKIADTSKGADLKVSLSGGVESYSQKTIADTVTIEANLYDETILCVENDGINKTSVTVELIKDEAQPLSDDGVIEIELAKGESKLISYVAKEDNRYLITKENDKVTMTLEKMQDASVSQSGYVDMDDLDDDLIKIEAPKDVVLGKADKLVYRLSYPDNGDERAPEKQTVKVTIAAIAPTAIDVAAPKEVTSEGWYQFTAQKDAIYTFSLEDEYKNDASDMMAFYSYMTGEELSDQSPERYMKNGQKVFIKLSGIEEGSKYTLKCEEVEVITEGTYTLDFEYEGEVQERKFVVPNGGSYKISAAAFRGEFTVGGTMNDAPVMPEFETQNGRGDSTTGILKKDDIVTLKVTANSGDKSSVSIRITKDNVAETMTLGTEYTGVSSKDKDIYYEIRIAETAFYAISAGGEPTVSYDVNGEDKGEVIGVVYTPEKLTEGDRVMIKVANGNEYPYSVKIAKVDATSLDGDDKATAEKPLEVKTAGETASATNTGEKDYVFTKEKAYVKFIAPEDGNYYIAVQAINDNANIGYPIITPSKSWSYPADMVELKKDETVVFEVTNRAAESVARANAASSKEAMFRLTIRLSKPADKNPIDADVEMQGTLAKNETVYYQFKVTKKAKYAISFTSSKCDLGEYSDGYEFGELDVDTVKTLTVRCSDGEGLGRYKLSVTELTQAELKPGVTASGTLKTDAKAYYVFAPTVTAEDGVKYQVYWSGNVSVSYGINDAAPAKMSQNNDIVTLMKDQKLSLTVENNVKGSKNRNQGFKLTVKEVKSTPITAANTAVDGSLDASEKAFYEFTSQNEKETPYQVYLDTVGTDVSLDQVQMVTFEGEGADRKLGDPETVDPTDEVQLEKGEKLLITVANSFTKTNSYKLTVEDKTESPVEPTTIALGVKQTGKLNTAKEKAAYEFTADADETYSVYFTGATCSYSWKTTETDAEGKAEEKTYSGSWMNGSREFSWKKGDKITFTVSTTKENAPSKYELTVKKVTYTELTLGTQVSRTLNPGETVYYQFISKDTPATGEETTKYQIYGSGSIQTRTLTVGDDGKTDADNQYWSYAWYEDEKSLQKEKQILQFKATGTFNLTIKKVEYKPITLGTPVSGRFTFADDGNPYYEFTATDTPAEGAATTRYYVYGTGNYDYRKSIKDGDKITWSDVNEGYPGTDLWLEKDQRVRFKVTDSPYNLTVAKYPEAKPITVGTEIRTGSLTSGQQLVYTLKNDKDTAAYTLNYKETDGAWISPYLDDEYLDDDYKRIIISKGSELRIEIGAWKDVDDFAFTVSEFKPEELKLGETASKVLAAGETVYYQYPVAKTADYVLSMVSSKGLTYLRYEVGEETKYSRYGNFVNDALNFTEKVVVLFEVRNDGSDKESFKLTLQEKPDDTKMTALEVKDNAFSLKAGEVKYLKFTVPEAEKKNGTIYVLSYPEMSGVQYSSTGLALSSKYVDEEWIYYDSEVSDFTMRVANTSMSDKTCSINLQTRETLTLGTASAKTIKPGETVYYQYKVAEAGEYVLSMAEKDSGSVILNGPAISNGVAAFNLEANVVQLLEVSANDKVASYKLTLQKKPADDKMEKLPAVSATLQPGDVKYFKFTVPEGKSGSNYALSIPKTATSGALRYYITVNDGLAYDTKFYGDYDDVWNVTTNIVVRVANVVVGADNCNCSIDVQEYPYAYMASGDTQTITKETATQYYVMYCNPDNYKLTLTNEEKDVKVEYSTDTKATKSWTAVPADGKIALKDTSYTQIFLKVSYSGKDAERTYTVTLDPWTGTGTE